jgi:uncharacterized membrane protein
MRKLYYLVSAVAIATMVAALAVPASAQPFSEVMGSWGYGGYGAFHMVLWVLILIGLIFGVVWRVWIAKHRRSAALDVAEKKNDTATQERGHRSPTRNVRFTPKSRHS